MTMTIIKSKYLSFSILKFDAPYAFIFLIVAFNRKLLAVLSNFNVGTEKGSNAGTLTSGTPVRRRGFTTSMACRIQFSRFGSFRLHWGKSSAERIIQGEFKTNFDATSRLCHKTTLLTYLYYFRFVPIF